MNFDSFISKYNGQKVASGQCGDLVRAYWNEVDLTRPESYPNSKDYWFNPVTGYDKVSSPQRGDIAIYNGHAGFPEGHSAIYYDGRVFEQNADPDGSPAHLYPRGNTYLLGYLRKVGSVDVNQLQQQIKDLQAQIDILRPDLVNANKTIDGLRTELDNERKGYEQQIAALKAQIGAQATVLKPGIYQVQ